jgi:DNA-binding PadR family transcriptional regulator
MPPEKISMENQSSMTKYFILGALKENDMHGYELIMMLEKVLGKKPSASQIYPVLKKMSACGYVTISSKKSGKRQIKSYKIAKSGIALHEDLSKRINLIISAALKERIKICAHCGCELISGAVSRKMGGKTLYFCCSLCAGSFKGVSL